ncbi:hypothetical protein BpHYR1_049940 [Brachionus plicatilis]|uniref:Uncharacterized protein n=1 Tax=Brachionus plicatilis TaxID=10195 RepID=A0A3M7RX02_BRAPC|nr:hypothetical protein BpHYR1_049940 [Brachionus plicatilis]
MIHICQKSYLYRKKKLKNTGNGNGRRFMISTKSEIRASHLYLITVCCYLILNENEVSFRAKQLLCIQWTNSYLYFTFSLINPVRKSPDYALDIYVTLDKFLTVNRFNL